MTAGCWNSPVRREAIDEVDRGPSERDIDRQALSEAVGATNVAINRYRVPPGEGLPGGLHAHADQEELFVVLAGTATFETWSVRRASDDTGHDSPDPPTTDTDLSVSAGEVIRFAPGEFQSGRNAGDEDLVVLAIGAPATSRDVRIPIECPECQNPDLRLEVADRTVFVCPSCGAERVPADCPNCGHGELQVTRANGGMVIVCTGCESQFSEPPYRT